MTWWYVAVSCLLLRAPRVGLSIVTAVSMSVINLQHKPRFTYTQVCYMNELPCLTYRLLPSYMSGQEKAIRIGATCIKVSQALLRCTESHRYILVVVDVIFKGASVLDNYSQPIWLDGASNWVQSSLSWYLISRDSDTSIYSSKKHQVDGSL